MGVCQEIAQMESEYTPSIRMGLHPHFGQFLRRGVPLKTELATYSPSRACSYARIRTTTTITTINPMVGEATSETQVPLSLPPSLQLSLTTLLLDQYHSCWSIYRHLYSRPSNWITRPPTHPSSRSRSEKDQNQAITTDSLHSPNFPFR